MVQQTEPSMEYCCPGERYAISRAVHLGRLARFYPGCRQCPHRDDIGTLSARQLAQLVETRPRGLARTLFHDEGVGGCELTPLVARDLAAAFGRYVASERNEELGRQLHCRPDLPEQGWQYNCHPNIGPNDAASVVLAGDGRPLTAEFVAAAGEGLRWSGCQVVDIGPASTACLMFAVDHFGAAGGLLVGNPGVEPGCVGLKFFAPGPRPVSAGPAMEALERAYASGGDRPSRAFGPLRRFQIQEPYLAGFAPYYHALRPLRFVLDSACDPLTECLLKLTSLVACEVLPRRTTRDALPEQVRDDGAHFAASVDGDGETCCFLDEYGRAVPPERMAVLIARHLSADNPRNAQRVPRPSRPCEEPTLTERQWRPCATVVPAVRKNASGVSAVSSPGTAETAVAHAERSVPATGSRAATFAAMRQEKVAFADSGDGRLWYSSGNLPLPDALMTISLLLVLLSRSDRPFSEVLDREAVLP